MNGVASPTQLESGDLTRRMLGHFRSPKYQPPVLPVIAVELMVLTQQIECSTAQITEVLERDPLLVARALRAARRGPFVAMAAPKSLAEAVTRLGNAALRDLVFEASLNSRVLHAPGYTEVLERLRVHSVSTAHIARFLSKRFGIGQDSAFLIGLLHDIGVAGICIALSQMPNAPPIEVAWPTVLRVHSEASGVLTRLWRLPEKIQQAVAVHHELKIAGRPSRLLALLCVAERLAFELAPLVGADPSTPDHPQLMPGKDFSPAHTTREACRMLRIDGRTWTRLKAEAQTVLDGI